ncbi:phage integrase [Peribacillus asahii]|uniref:Phage integrase n=1 Tax=Peribacillus asahii TaxID=228899 RepID=A0A3Q9RNC4_9BACI|nr:site-specific integrase [Peribacillus asahii]AZV43627.1 phage integrase [Peribacillus asahii]
MQAANNKEVKLLNAIENNRESKISDLHDYKVFNDIQNYFNDLETFSKNTKRGYERDIKDFFEGFLKKDIRYLTENDLKIDKKLILKFRKWLIDSEEYANSTINRKIRGLKSLYDTLSSYEYDVNLNSFNKIRELPNKTKAHGTLTPEEAFKMAELALETEREQKKIKYYLIQTAIRTSLRISDLLALEWNDFKEKDDLVVITIYEEKTNKETEKPLVRSFHEELLSIKEEGKDKVFNIDRDTITRMMKRLRVKMGFPPERNIVFHSFRNVGINFVLDVTGDVKAAAEQGNHSNINTTYSHYLDRNKNYDNMAGVLMDKELNENVLNDLSKEELLELIDKLSFKSKVELIKLAEGNIK